MAYKALHALPPCYHLTSPPTAFHRLLQPYWLLWSSLIPPFTAPPQHLYASCFFYSFSLTNSFISFQSFFTHMSSSQWGLCLHVVFPHVVYLSWHSWSFLPRCTASHPHSVYCLLTYYLIYLIISSFCLSSLLECKLHEGAEMFGFFPPMYYRPFEQNQAHSRFSMNICQLHWITE